MSMTIITDKFITSECSSMSVHAQMNMYNVS